MSNSLSLDAEFQEYIAAFRTTSQSVRWTMVALAITSLLILAGYINQKTESWIDSRLTLSQVALDNHVWTLSEKNLDPKIEAARLWLIHRNFKSADDVKVWKELLMERKITIALTVRVPILGLAFDVNDLGILGGVALSVLMLILAMCLARQHSNLYLGLWRVRKLWRDEQINPDIEEESSASRANVLYHAMAMASVFGKPPTLARWKGRSQRIIYSYFLYGYPLLVQFNIFHYDMKSLGIGLILNRNQAIRGTVIEVVTLIFILVMTFYCIVYSRVSDIRWERTFLYINRHLDDKGIIKKRSTGEMQGKDRKMEHSSWWKWVNLSTTGAISLLAGLLVVTIGLMAWLGWLGYNAGLGP